MEKSAILVVDDEKNIRITIAYSLEQMKIPVETAADGQEALQKLRSGKFRLVFLDLRMPGMDGMELLRIIKEEWPDIRVVIITAHGSISSAVEAMKIGAVDFIQKPFSQGEICELASRLLESEPLDASNVADYCELIELARRYIADQNFRHARTLLSKAIARGPEHPQAYNLLGALLEISHESIEAQKFYRAALDIDPTYKPAWFNLERATSMNGHGDIDFGSAGNIGTKEI